MVRTRHSNHPVAGLWLVFFLNGAVLASWAPRIPEVKSDLGLSDAALGVALFGVAAGSVPALLGTGWLLRFTSARLLCVLSGALFAGFLPLIAAARGVLGLALVLVLLGAASGCLDVAMNTAGIEFQQRSPDRPSVISRLHGGYSLGVLFGAAGGALATGAGVGVFAHFTAVAGVLLVLLAVAAPALPHTPVVEPAQEVAPAVSPLRGIAAIPLAIAAIAVSGLLVEGMVTDWSALLVARDFAGGVSLGSTAVVAFSVAMFVSRSVGDALVVRFGRRAVLRWSAGAVAVALAVGLAQPSAVGAFAAVAFVGLALGPVFPLSMTAAADRVPHSVATAAAGVSAVGYLAYLAGPPLIGVVAEAVGLVPTVAAIGLAASLTTAVAARRLDRNPRRLAVAPTTKEDGDDVGTPA
ncbi:Membrane protein mosC [Actinokineospora spheciospongiae]|uniref:Membrane protein mosC n=1 Tax=Actinokineospora spheciospongiae TaxID=909613 RepID=W7J072_9PSEU|nr:MFS transporter [Actinokineospora spheciospongiae]EWC62372.1 Membrane protein mosC [Actinokineospora spheciospongiae]